MLGKGGGAERSLRLVDQTRSQGEWSEVEALADNMIGRLRSLDQQVRWFLEQIEHLELEDEPGLSEGVAVYGARRLRDSPLRTCLRAAQQELGETHDAVQRVAQLV